MGGGRIFTLEYTDKNILYMNSCLRSFLEMQCLIYVITIKLSSFKSVSMLNKRISGENWENLFIPNLFYYILLHIFIMVIVDQVNDVADGPLVYYIDYFVCPNDK